MQTALPKDFLETPEGREADSILRACVHCGFCTATCPTFQVLGNELDSPRGRIYLIKEMLEGSPVSEITQTHLDRCLTCQACETTCPSGVIYHRLVDIGRAELERRVPRPRRQRIMRWLLRRVLSYRRRFTPILRLAQALRFAAPASLKRAIPPSRPARARPEGAHARRVILFEGCVQPGLAPATNAAAARLLNRLGIGTHTVPEEGCCGALSYHMNAQAEGKRFAKRNIDAWWPAIESGAEAILVTASGCGNFIGEYGRLLRDEPAYAEKAAAVDSLMRDIGDFLADEDTAALTLSHPLRAAFQCPCTLQHGLNVEARVQALLGNIGFDLPAVADSHLCCGSAGTYAIFQPDLARDLRARKLSTLAAQSPDLIMTANIGCQTHLAAATGIPVKHWVEVLDDALTAEGR